MERISLTQKDHFFYLLFYEHSTDEDPKLQMPFPYHADDRDKILKEARNHGREMAENLGAVLDESLETIA